MQRRICLIDTGKQGHSLAGKTYRKARPSAQYRTFYHWNPTLTIDNYLHATHWYCPKLPLTELEHSIRHHARPRCEATRHHRLSLWHRCLRVHQRRSAQISQPGQNARPRESDGVICRSLRTSTEQPHHGCYQVGQSYRQPSNSRRTFQASRSLAARLRAPAPSLGYVDEPDPPRGRLSSSTWPETDRC